MKRLEIDKIDKKDKKIKGILVIPMILLILVGCDWLDVVPDNLPTVDDVFKTRATAERFLFSCYSYLPDPTSPYGYPAYFTSRDEFEYGTHGWSYAGYSNFIARGEQNTSNPYLDFWSGRNGARSMFQAIRTCDLFLEGIHQPRDLSAHERTRWVAEVKFLKAYYHFFLLKLYGPIPLIRESVPLSANPEEVRVFREPVDECVDYIAQLIDEAAPGLPLTIDDPVREDGRITQPIALAVKAKALAWGASPLFNGNEDYRNWRDSRDKQLVLDVYSKEKWVKAAEAIREAIDVADLAQHKLYKYNKSTHPSTFRMSDSLAWTMNTRKAITEKWNSGIIWSSTFRFGWKGHIGEGGRSDNNENMQLSLFPGLHTNDEGNLTYASFNMAELFYTNKGIPIDEDEDWNYDGRFDLRLSDEDAGHGLYIRLGQQTAAIHFDREPRFYANLGFDRGYFELAVLTNNGGQSFMGYVASRQGDPGNQFIVNNSGYHVKKLIAFETSCSWASTIRGLTVADYRFPLIRLSDLYLLYSEALNEIKDTPDDEVYDWIDQVRAIAGLDGVVDSWKKSRYPNRPFDKDEMRKIIQQERLIELAFEGQRFWDLRRWKLYEQSRSYEPKGWNWLGKSAEDYYTIVYTASPLVFSVRDYLWPIRDWELSVNPNLVQTWGW